jgi:hypothetical protein
MTSARLLLVATVLLPPPNCFGQVKALRTPVPPPDACKLLDSLAADSPDSGRSGADLAARILAIYNAQAQLERSIKTTGDVRVVRGASFGAEAGKTSMLGAFLSFEKPAWVRATGIVPLAGAKAFDLSSDGREFRLLAPDHGIMTLFTGPAEAAPDFSAGTLGLRPREFLDALRWPEGAVMLSEQRPAGGAADGVTVDFALPAGDGKSATGRLHFDMQSGVVSALQLFNAAGETDAEIHYADWRLTNDASAPAKQACYPRKVQSVHAKEDFQILIRFADVTFNSRIPRSSFRFSVPKGTRTVRVDEQGHPQP